MTTSYNLDNNYIKSIKLEHLYLYSMGKTKVSKKKVASKDSKLEKEEPTKEPTEEPTEEEPTEEPMEEDPTEEEPTEDKVKEIHVPEKFIQIISEFSNDLSITFPEYSFLWEKWTTQKTENEIIELFEYVLTVYPERFFDIIYQNDDIFQNDSSYNTMFLPNVEFKALYNCDGITDTTKKTIWKYLQLVLFSILNSIGDKTKFGDTMNIFDTLDENFLQTKMEETIHSINDFFMQMNKSKKEVPDNDTNEYDSLPETNEKTEEEQNDNSNKMHFDFEENMPNPEELHEHLKTLFDGKIGKLAKELAEEISNDMSGFIGEDVQNVRSSEDVIKLLLKNPQKMTNLVKTIGKKINTKMESGEISHEDITKEATELFSKMKDMGNTKQFNEIFQNMAKNMANTAGAKVDTNAMNQKMNQNLLKEKLRKRLQHKKENKPAVEESETNNPMNDLLSSMGNLGNLGNLANMENIEKLMKDFGLDDMKLPQPNQNQSNKKKKGKK